MKAFSAARDALMLACRALGEADAEEERATTTLNEHAMRSRCDAEAAVLAAARALDRAAMSGRG